MAMGGILSRPRPAVVDIASLRWEDDPGPRLTRCVAGARFIQTAEDLPEKKCGNGRWHHERGGRSVREFSDRAVPKYIIEHALRTAGSAPSGANMQPWHFVAVSDPGLKKRIREAAEVEEKALYEHRASAEWLEAIEPLGTNEHKPFLETAPWLIAVFLKKFTIDDAGVRHKNYYPSESVGIACGFLLAALHWSGLATLTHTPSPMKFLCAGSPTRAGVHAHRTATGGDATVPALASIRWNASHLQGVTADTEQRE
jgi:hypothetical protein